MSLKFSNLTAEEVKLVTNGCGNKKGVIRAPSFIFLASCNHHDFNYKLGFKEKDRKRADRQFYEAMQEDIKEYKGLRSIWYQIWAGLYYLSVRLGGWMFFKYGKHRLTRAELNNIIKKIKEKRNEY